MLLVRYSWFGIHRKDPAGNIPQSSTPVPNASTHEMIRLIACLFAEGFFVGIFTINFNPSTDRFKSCLILKNTICGRVRIFQPAWRHSNGLFWIPAQPCLGATRARLPEFRCHLTICCHEDTFVRSHLWAIPGTSMTLRIEKLKEQGHRQLGGSQKRSAARLSRRIIIASRHSTGRPLCLNER